MTDTSTPSRRKVRVESVGAKHTGGRVTIDGEDISNHVLAADVHLDARSLPTVTLELVGAEIDIEGNLVPTAAAPQPDVIEGEIVGESAPRLMCVGCTLEHHAGQRETINPATLIVGGQSTCRDHFQIVDSPLLPGRTASGLILGNGG